MYLAKSSPSLEDKRKYIGTNLLIRENKKKLWESSCEGVKIRNSVESVLDYAIKDNEKHFYQKMGI